VVHLETGVVVMATEIYIETFICLKVFREVLLLRDILLVGFKVLVDTFSDVRL